VSRYSLYPHVPPSISRRSVRLQLPLASPDVSAFPTITDGVDLRIAVFGICSTFTARCGPRGRQTTQRWPSTPKALTASLPPRPLRLLPAGEAVAGWVYLPLRERTFPRRTEIQASTAAQRTTPTSTPNESTKFQARNSMASLVAEYTELGACETISIWKSSGMQEDRGRLNVGYWCDVEPTRMTRLTNPQRAAPSH